MPPRAQAAPVQPRRAHGRRAAQPALDHRHGQLSHRAHAAVAARDAAARRGPQRAHDAVPARARAAAQGRGARAPLLSVHRHDELPRVGDDLRLRVALGDARHPRHGAAGDGAARGVGGALRLRLCRDSRAARRLGAALRARGRAQPARPARAHARRLHGLRRGDARGRRGRQGGGRGLSDQHRRRAAHEGHQPKGRHLLGAAGAAGLLDRGLLERQRV